MLKILTLTWNGKEKLTKLYPTLLNSLENIEYEWFVKDNGSIDNSIEYIKELNNPNIRLIECNHNRDSFAQGCNVLFKEASPKDDDLILLLNNDIIFNDTTSIKNMISIIQNDDSVGAVGAKLNYTDTDRLQHAGVIFDKKYNMLPFHYRPNEKEDDNARKDREFQSITGAVWLTKAKYYENISRDPKTGLKGLDHGFIWAFDDIDANLSIKYKMGKKIVYCGSTNVFHEESASLKKNPVNKLFINSNVQYFLKKWGGAYKEDHNQYLNNPEYNLYKK